MQEAIEKNKLLRSLISFNNNSQIIKHYSENFILQNDIKAEQFNFDNIFYLKQITHFSKLKYINTNFKQIEEEIFKRFDQKIGEFYIKKINVIKKLPLTFISNFESLYYKLAISFKNAKIEKNIKLVSEDLIQYSKKLKEFTDIISESFESGDEDRYNLLIKFQNPNFSTSYFEEIFSSISGHLKQSFSYLSNSSKCIKIQQPDQSLLKNHDFLGNIDAFFDEHFAEFFNKAKDNQNKALNFDSFSSNQRNESTQSNSDFKSIIENKINHFIKNFLMNLSLEENKASDLKIIFENFNSLNDHSIFSNFILNFYSKGQFFLENMAQNIIKNIKIKGKVFETKNIFWIFNSAHNEEKEFNLKNSNEISQIFFSMIQYVIERDFINNSEIVRVDDLVDGWKSGMKHYFDADVNEMHFLENFNHDPFKCGLAGFDVFANLKSAEFFNKFSENQNSENTFFKTCTDIVNFENNQMINPSSNNLDNYSSSGLINEYKKYLKNKFGINF